MKDNKISQKLLAQEREHIYQEMVDKQNLNLKRVKVAPKDSYLYLNNINKIYSNRIQAVFDFNLSVKKGEFIVLVGPSGCGKSTTLRMIAGLEDITFGDLFIDNTFCNTLEPKNRNIAMVFQSYALYPNMTVYDNLAFSLHIKKVQEPKLDKNGNVVKSIDKKKVAALKKEKKNLQEYLAAITDTESEDYLDNHKRLAELEQQISYFSTTPTDVYVSRKLTAEEIDSKVRKVADTLQLTEYLGRKPKALSGGQRQRVALGRAIVRDAKVFLMDEPLSNLDAKLRVQMRSEIIELHKNLGATIVYVTHDQTEAMTMASRIVVMDKGRIQQIGTPSEVYNSPSNIFVATFIGTPSMNLIDGELQNNTICLPEGLQIEITQETMQDVRNFAENAIEENNKKVEKVLATLDSRTKLLKALKNEKGNFSADELEEIKAEIKNIEENHQEVVELKQANQKYAESLQSGKFQLVVGIRPEDIHEVSFVNKDVQCSSKVATEIAVPELNGSDYFVRTTYNQKTTQLKMPATKPLSIGQKIEIVLDLNKINLFDKVSGRVINIPKEGKV